MNAELLFHLAGAVIRYEAGNVTVPATTRADRIAAAFTALTAKAATYAEVSAALDRHCASRKEDLTKKHILGVALVLAEPRITAKKLKLRLLELTGTTTRPSALDSAFRIAAVYERTLSPEGRREFIAAALATYNSNPSLLL